MKKVIISFVLVLFTTLSLSAQDKAIGLRFGGGNFVGTEISYQTPFKADRLELNLGLRSSSDWNYWSLTGIYQWVMPIDAGFYWYLGVGPSLGQSSYSGNKNEDDGLFLSAALNAGIEYYFEDIPLQIAVDTRPELGLINVGSTGFFGLALSLRYCF